MSGTRPNLMRDGLPAGWVWTKIKVVGEVKLGRQRAPKNHNGPHMRPYLRVANVFEDRLDFSDVKEMNFSPKEFDTFQLLFGDVLLNEGQSPHLVGRPAIWRDEKPGMCFTNTLVRFRAHVGVVSEYAMLVFRTQMHFQRYMKIAKITTNIAHLGAGRFAEVEFPLPPTREQERIVTEWATQSTRLDSAVATLKRVQANLKRARASVLKAAVEGRLVPTEAELTRAESRSYEPADVLLERILVERRRKHDEAQVGAKRQKKYKEPVEPDTKGLPELPEGWVWALPEQLASAAQYALAIGPFGSNLKVPDYRDSGVPLVFVRNIRSGDFSGVGGKFVDPTKAAELRAHQCQSHDILITKMGDPPGDSWVYPPGRPPAVVTADVVKWTVEPSVGLPWFFAYATRAASVKSQILQQTKGVAQKKISLARFKAVTYPLPPRAEQVRIVAGIERQFSVLDAVEQTVERNLLRCTALRQAILKRAFEGKLVPQDPSDEPASELLARIQA